MIEPEKISSNTQGLEVTRIKTGGLGLSGEAYAATEPWPRIQFAPLCFAGGRFVFMGDTFVVSFCMVSVEFSCERA